MVDTIFVVGFCSDKLAPELLPALCYALGVFSGLAIFPYVMARAGLGFKTLKKSKTPKKSLWEKTFGEARNAAAKYDPSRPRKLTSVELQAEEKIRSLKAEIAAASAQVKERKQLLDAARDRKKDSAFRYTPPVYETGKYEEAKQNLAKLKAKLDEVTAHHKNYTSMTDREYAQGIRPDLANAANGTTDYQKIKTAEIEIPVIAEDVLVYQGGELGSAYPDVTRLFYSKEAISDPDYLETVLRSPLQVQTHEKNTSEFNRGVDGWPLSAWWDEAERRTKVRGVLHGEDNVRYAEENRNQPNFGTSAYISFLEIDRTPGIAPNGKPYDAVVRKAVNNHIAILPNVRDPKNVILAMNAVREEEGETENASKDVKKWEAARKAYVDALKREGKSEADMYTSAGRSTPELKKLYDEFSRIHEQMASIPWQHGHNALSSPEESKLKDRLSDLHSKKDQVNRTLQVMPDDDRARTALRNIVSEIRAIEKKLGTTVYNEEESDMQDTKNVDVQKRQAADDAWRRELEKEFGKKAGEARYDSRGKSTPTLKRLYDAYVASQGKSTNANNQEKNMDYEEFKGHMNAYEKEKDSENQLVEKVTNAVLEKMNATKNEDKPSDEKPVEEKKEAGNADEKPPEEKKEEKEEAANALPSESMVKDFSDALGITFKTTPSLKELALVAGVNGAGSPAELIAALNAKRETLRKPVAASAQNSSGAPVSIDDLIKQM